MKAQELRNAILQLAVQGKLVPQNPTDEPASELLKKIKSEREQLIKDKKIKREKPLPDITDDEKLFEIPNSWEWVRLGVIGDTNIGLTYKPTDISDNGIAVLRSNNIQNGRIDYSNLIKVNKSVSEKLIVKRNDILICARNGSKSLVGKSALIEVDGMTFGAFMAIYRCICNNYVHKYLNSQAFRNQLGGSNTTTINQITQDMLKNIIIPLPPSNEQQRIVAKIEEIMPKIDKYDKLEQELSLLEENFPDNLRKSILQYAVQGKLVPQNPADEPVSVLLEKIRAEKEQLVKEKKIKSEKPLPEITDEEKLFEIPDGWEWVRLENISLNIHYGFTASALPKGNTKLLRITDIQDNIVKWNNVPYCQTNVKELETYGLNNRDILIARTGGTIGKTYIVDGLEENSVFASYLIRVVPSKFINEKYLKFFLESPFYWKQLREKSMGTGQPNVNGTALKELIVVLPPLDEQQRIVAKIEELTNLFKVIADEKALAQYKPKPIESNVIPFPTVMEQEDEDFPQVVGFRSNDESIDADELKELMEVADKHTK